MAGQVIMQGFVGFRIPLWLRRLLTMLPTVVVVFTGVDPTQSLFYSQVVLSLVLPIPIIALIYFTRRRGIMGALVNRRTTTWLASVVATVILLLNFLLLYEQVARALIPGLPGIPGLG
jgi:manganese transport protein